jgi:hypothetical protein
VKLQACLWTFVVHSRNRLKPWQLIARNPLKFSNIARRGNVWAERIGVEGKVSAWQGSRSRANRSVRNC